MKNKSLTLSIVIPVYNEESYLKSCLDSIAGQSVKPNEVIVVNNNSTDKSSRIASSYSFVTVVNEYTQGIVFVRNRGFNAAKSDIIGRIDADTHLSANWVKEALGYFQKHNKISAVTGDCYFYDFPLRTPLHHLHKFIYYIVQRWIAGTVILWGSNMAIRQHAWQKVKTITSDVDNMHEDIDLSLKLKKLGLEVAHVNNLKAEVSLRRGDLGLNSLNKYLTAWHNTYAINKLYIRSIFIIFLGLLTFLSALIIQPFRRLL